VTKACPACGKEVSLTATRCPSCRAEIASASTAGSVREVEPFGDAIRRFLLRALGLAALAAFEVWIDAAMPVVAFFAAPLLSLGAIGALIVVARDFLRDEAEILEACAVHDRTRWLVGLVCLAVALVMGVVVYQMGVLPFLYSRFGGLFGIVRTAFLALVALAMAAFFAWRGVTILRA
jgi:hypothetical protein